MFNEEDIEDLSTNTARVVVLVTFFSQAIANQFLASIKDLTVIVHMFILDLSYPVATQKFFGALFPLIAFEVLDANELIYTDGFKFGEVEGENTELNE